MTYKSKTMDFSSIIADELHLALRHVSNVIKLLGEGATIPFIARYRKEMTGSMNEENVAAVQKRLEQLTELQKRKESVIESIREQDKLTPELEQKILNAKTMQEVEDLYLPYKPSIFCSSSGVSLSCSRMEAMTLSLRFCSSVSCSRRFCTAATFSSSIVPVISLR